METPFPAYRGEEPYIFVCYSHANAAVVYPELERLRKLGINVYYDEGVSPGREWTQELADAIDGSSRLLYFVSPASAASRHCRNEVQYALDRQKSVIPVHLEPTELPGGMQLSLGSAQAILKHELNPKDYRRKLSAALYVGDTPADIGARSERPRPHLAWRAVVPLVGLGVIATTLLLWSDRGLDNNHGFDRSLAVTPFSAVSDDESLTVLANSITDELRGQLTNYHELRVVDASATLYRVSDGGAPAASYSVSGTLQSTGNEIVVRSELVRKRDKEIIWFKRFRVPKVESSDRSAELAEDVSKVIRFELTKDHECESIRNRSKSREAAELLCKGFAEHYLATQGQGSDARLVFANAQKAVQLDPELVDGYHLLAIGYALMSSYGEMASEEAYPAALSAVDEALALDPDNAFTLFQLGIIESLFSLNWEQADRYLNGAINLDPLHPHAAEFHQARAYVALAKGEVALAIGNSERSVKLNNANGRAFVEYARALNSGGMHADALDAARSGIELLPTGPWRSILTAELVFAAFQLGDSDTIRRELSAAYDAIGPQWKMLLADSFAMAGEIDQAEQLLSRLEASSPSLPTFEVWTNLALGRLDVAFSRMPSAIDRREGIFLTGLRAHPRYDPMRRDPRREDVMAYLREAETTEAERRGNSL